MTDVFISPHNDDASLFGAFSILARQNIVVIVVFDSYKQGIDRIDRRLEDQAAMRYLGGPPIFFCGLRDDVLPAKQEIRSRVHHVLSLANVKEIGSLFVPATYGPRGHEHHELVGSSLEDFERGTLVQYHTYTDIGKVEKGREVKPQRSAHVRMKLRALSCYVSQIDNDGLGCWQHFMRDQREWIA